MVIRSVPSAPNPERDRYNKAIVEQVYPAGMSAFGTKVSVENAYEIKDQLKKLGFVWEATIKYWALTVCSEDTLAAVAQAKAIVAASAKQSLVRFENTSSECGYFEKYVTDDQLQGHIALGFKLITK
jgi:hypothetical protein